MVDIYMTKLSIVCGMNLIQHKASQLRFIANSCMHIPRLRNMQIGQVCKNTINNEHTLHKAVLAMHQSTA